MFLQPGNEHVHAPLRATLKESTVLILSFLMHVWNTFQCRVFLYYSGESCIANSSRHPKLTVFSYFTIVILVLHYIAYDMNVF